MSIFRLRICGKARFYCFASSVIRAVCDTHLASPASADPRIADQGLCSWCFKSHRRKRMKFLDSFFQTKGYRPDVDGLMALAILAVVLFHAWPDHFGFGIFGVDIFFVISGYLITGIIIRDLDKGCFSFRQFYHRRILRIIPHPCYVFWLPVWQRASLC